MDLTSWLGLLALSTVAVLTPGPTLLAVVGHAAAVGFRRTVPVVVGNAVGIAVVIAVSIAGLAGALLRAPGLLTAVQLAGAAYVGWHGVKTWWNRAVPMTITGDRAGSAPLWRG
ncbi:MAG TPA: LysE family transporter, partial [Myxococcaceae bacterium]|nr:LysE family transporter [Myxococcaceae bacterium]